MCRFPIILNRLMSLLRKLFGAPEPSAPPPDVRFGRFSDHYKTVWSHAALERAEQCFAEGKFVQAVREFLDFLANEGEDNVRYHEEKGILHFRLYQGSRILTGTADRQRIRAVARIVLAEGINTESLHRFVSDNYRLHHCRFAIDPENYLSLVFDAYSADTSPYILYRALRETALLADRLDDLLWTEFGLSLPSEEDTRTDLTRRELRIRINYLRREIEAILFRARSSALAAEHPGAFSYVLLHLCYKLDYLTKPEGFVGQQFDQINGLFFNRGQNSVRETNLRILELMEQILQRTDEQLREEFYRVRFTFGVTDPISSDKVAAMIRSEMPRADWYRENGYPEVSFHIAGYLVGYILYHYAPPPDLRELLKLFFQITEADFYSQLGFTQDFSHAKGGLNRNNIRQALQRWRNRFPQQDFKNADINRLDLSDIDQFSRTFMSLIAS